MRWGAAAALFFCAATPLALVVAAQRVVRSPEPEPVPMHEVSQLVTAAPVYDSLAALRGGERFPRGAELMLLRNGRLQSFVADFAASADASVSFDGKTVLFAGRKTASDRWQIWEIELDGGAPRLVLSGPTDLIRPLWMPDHRLVYARKGASGFALETAALDGSAVTKLSYVPGNLIPDDVLPDGRILFESGFPLGAGTTPEMYLVYADGSGVESVRCDHPTAERSGREHGRQMASGDIVFTQGSRLARFTSALAEEAPIAAPPGAYAGDVAQLADGRWVLSMRKSGEKHYALAVWKPGTATLTLLARDAERELIEPVLVETRAVPHRHPSALHSWTTGNLLALDARQSREGVLRTAPALVRVESLDASGHAIALGTAPVEKDGSFFVQAPGDRPLRFLLLDAAGHPLRQEHGWFWVRSGEQRICVGCHTGPERAPENRVPEVLLRSTTPADVTGGLAAAGGAH
ncbi:MAG TPA: hypothetical protein VHZ09_07980 [Acidobacteriaceae bacterium]|jgi:hypothetical protein|nr:hypothetical protein [Acidobacteriaceae bacterium]